jgi:hypothetical protein
MAQTAAPRDAVSLAGTITATSAASIRTVVRMTLAGRITAHAHLVGRTAPTYLVGRITAQGKAQVQRPVLNVAGTTLQLLYGNAVSSVQARFQSPAFTSSLSGRITVQATARSAPPLITTAPLVTLTGRITATLRASLNRAKLTPEPLNLSGSIYANSVAQLGTGPYYVTNLAGWTQSGTTLVGTAGPWQPYLIGSITASAQMFLGIAEIQPPLPPYPPPFLTFTTLDYLDRITSEHNQKPKYVATVALTADAVVQDQQLVAGIAGLFDLDYCIGEQEDFTGQWIGKSRWIELPATFFSWDTEGAGWNQANWKGPADASSNIERLDDYHYRLLLYANIIANHWNGSIPQAYDAWDTLFHYIGLQVIIQDYGNMTMLYGLLSTQRLDAVLVSLFLTGQMDLRPEGVELIAYALQPEPGVPFFAWDATSDSVKGWDQGDWAIMLPPGSAYTPGVSVTVWDAPAPTQGQGPATTDDAQTVWDDGNTVWDK